MDAHSLSQLDLYLRWRDGGTPQPSQSERRSALVIAEPFPASVRGVDTTGERFRECAVLDSFSPWSLSLRLARSVELGARLFVVVRLSAAGAEAGPAPRVALRGMVARVERQADGRHGLQIGFARHRFLYAIEES